MPEVIRPQARDWRAPRWRPVRFIANGLGAALIHFLVLTMLLKGVGLVSAGLANALAAIVATCASFLGNRHFVFAATNTPWIGQFLRFWPLYLTVTMLHAGILFLWTDLAGWDYRSGFITGALLAAVVTYCGGRWWIFRPIE